MLIPLIYFNSLLILSNLVETPHYRMILKPLKHRENTLKLILFFSLFTGSHSHQFGPSTTKTSKCFFLSRFFFFERERERDRKFDYLVPPFKYFKNLVYPNPSLIFNDMTL